MKKILLFLLVLVSNCFSQLVPQFQHQPSVGYQINLAHPDAQGLIGRWLLHEGLGLKAYDLSPYGNDGTLTNMDESNWVVGRDGWALDFDGSGDFIRIPDRDTFTPSALTVSAWVKHDDTGSSDVIVSKWNFSENTEWNLFRNSTDLWRWVLRDNNSNNDLAVNSDTTPLVDTWYHVVGVWDGGFVASSIKIYVNGIEEGTGVESGDFVGLTNTTTDVFIGAQDITFNFNGLIGDVLIYNRALSSHEIMSIFVSQYAMFEQPPGRILVAAAAAAAIDRMRLIISND